MTNPSISLPTDAPTTPARFALTMLQIYRAIVSPLIVGLYGPACRFEPTCSEYAHQAIATHGALRGSMLAARRLARCHPLGGHGLDPVPAPTNRTRGEIGSTSGDASFGHQ